MAKNYIKIYPKEYRTWKGIKYRCYNIKAQDYYLYGGRGVVVCDRWINSFDNFFEDMGLAPSKDHTIDRFPNKNGNYSPENCRWATQVQQQNNRNDNYIITYNGETKTLSEWCRHLQLNINTIKNRIFMLNWDGKTALSTPIKKNSKKSNENCNPRKINKIDIKTNIIIKSFESISDAVKNGDATDASLVSKCCRNKNKYHNNYKWQYAD